MGGGRAVERQASDGEEAIETKGGGGGSTISTLNERKREEKRWVSCYRHGRDEEKHICLSFGHSFPPPITPHHIGCFPYRVLLNRGEMWWRWRRTNGGEPAEVRDPYLLR